MSDDKFVVRRSLKGYSIDLFRNGQHCVTFVDGLTEQNAEREARNLAALWARISTKSGPASLDEPSSLQVYPVGNSGISSQ